MDGRRDGGDGRAHGGADDGCDAAGDVEQAIEGPKAVRVRHQAWNHGLQRGVEDRLDPREHDAGGDQQRQGEADGEGGDHHRTADGGADQIGPDHHLA